MTIRCGRSWWWHWVITAAAHYWLWDWTMNCCCTRRTVTLEVTWNSGSGGWHTASSSERGDLGKIIWTCWRPEIFNSMSRNSELCNYFYVRIRLDYFKMARDPHERGSVVASLPLNISKCWYFVSWASIDVCVHNCENLNVYLFKMLISKLRTLWIPYIHFHLNSNLW